MLDSYLLKVWGLLFVKSFVSNERYLVLDSLLDRQPVEFLKDMGDVISTLGTGYHTSNTVLNTL